MGLSASFLQTETRKQEIAKTDEEMESAGKVSNVSRVSDIPVRLCTNRGHLSEFANVNT